MIRCRERVNKFIESTNPEETLDIEVDMRKIHFCYQYFKHLLQQANKAISPASNSSATTTKPADLDKEIAKLKELLSQRDQEINILVNLLKKEKARLASNDKDNRNRSASPTFPNKTKNLNTANRPSKKLSQVSFSLSLSLAPSLSLSLLASIFNPVFYLIFSMFLVGIPIVHKTVIRTHPNSI